MKEYYRFGDLLVTLRKEYMSNMKLLNELQKYIEIKSEYEKMYFRGHLLYKCNDPKENLEYKDNTGKITLIVEKKYNELLKKYKEIKYYNGWLFYAAQYDFFKNESGFYVPNYHEPFNLTTVAKRKRYIPEVEINNPEKFTNIMDQIYSSDIMQTEFGSFKINYDKIGLDFDIASMRSELDGGISLEWHGPNDEFYYNCYTPFVNGRVDELLSLEVPSYKISDNWLKLLEKYDSYLSSMQYSADISVKKKAKLKAEGSLETGKFKLALKK